MNKQDLKRFTQAVATNAIKNFIAYFKKYARDDSFDQLCWDGAVDMESIDNELDVAFEEYLKAKKE